MKKALLLIIATIFSATAQAQLLSTYSSLSTIDTSSVVPSCEDVIEHQVDLERQLDNCDSESYRYYRLRCYKDAGQQVLQVNSSCGEQVFDVTFEHVFLFHSRGWYNYTYYKNLLKGKIQQCLDLPFYSGGRECFINLMNSYPKTSTGYRKVFSDVIYDYYYKALYRL
ncbi:MAG: hypothetical protein EP326_04275 [Deltaproteobacteria bacterium]|nr:MAG: hypothetical protein EP326_04275 [Deltaproteobacteria bacterium]TNF26632.1 MAG: hypothetical protein EP319_13355 [Deltaproteobacteria bacterium]